MWSATALSGSPAKAVVKKSTTTLLFISRLVMRNILRRGARLCSVAASHLGEITRRSEVAEWTRSAPNEVRQARQRCADGRYRRAGEGRATGRLPASQRECDGTGGCATSEHRGNQDVRAEHPFV